MLSVAGTASRRISRVSRAVRFTTASASTSHTSHTPNAALDLDPSFRVLLKDADLALLKHKARHVSHPLNHRELEVLPFEDPDPFSNAVSYVTESGDDVCVGETLRKSPEARFGSQAIGSVYIPNDLRLSIERLIAGSDKFALHNNAKRIFKRDDSTRDDPWDSVSTVNYKSHKQAVKHAETDGTAFATVALPAHYAAICSVLDHVKRRFGNAWNIERVIDWGSGTGSALWATMHSFQHPTMGGDQDMTLEPHLSRSRILTYLGIEKRAGLTAIAKRLVKDVDVGQTSLSWQKGYTDLFGTKRFEGHDLLALSAFTLSSLPNPLARKDLVKEMWDSGANVMILIDHDSPSGFESIANARDYLLRMGKREFDDPLMGSMDHVGCHVVAPCPHDQACPLHAPGSTKLICSFSQRMQRPAFLRKTKHVKAGHEDTGFSYVVIRRGPRPTYSSAKYTQPAPQVSGDNVKEDKYGVEFEGRTETECHTLAPDNGVGLHSPSRNSEDSDDILRMQAYGWPRLIFPPLKKSGHVILDSCTREGRIMRLTIPRSQGKQEYYDARKSSWGDIFPHSPKNPPQIRSQTNAKGLTGLGEGSDIGKRKQKLKEQQATSYSQLASHVKLTKRDKRRERNRTKKRGDEEEL
ncbi:Rsm22-domain-containing protein [Rickenella mellea]|uniref:Rsm22-domain-containing protein n=1 Tax=Rickenella mellea TaxID=50990 RepID=A0A4Y7QMP0_9AGAM|nr:Rsm22-domain-containing protein [Rickenella mellea]